MQLTTITVLLMLPTRLFKRQEKYNELEKSPIKKQEHTAVQAAAIQ